jgi:hypothetical protein
MGGGGKAADHVCNTLFWERGDENFGQTDKHDSVFRSTVNDVCLCFSNRREIRVCSTCLRLHLRGLICLNKKLFALVFLCFHQVVKHSYQSILCPN